VAKNDIYSTRSSAFVDDDEEDAFSRPAVPSVQKSAASASSRVRSTRDLTSDRLVDKAAESLGQRLKEDEPLARIRRRVPVKRGLLPEWTRTRWGRILLVLSGLGLAAGAVALVLTVRNFLENDPRFRVDAASDIQTLGNSELTRADLLSVFGSDLGRNIFFVPLAARRSELEQIPWVQHATVMRLLPNELRVAVRERVPIAFVRVGDQVKLTDEDGVILDMPPAMMAAKHYSFPVVAGIHAGDPLAARKPRMAMYQRFVADLDASGEKISEQMSEIDLSDPEDVRATVPAKNTDLLLHFGDDNFLPRYRVYQQHLNEWEEQYPHLAAVDLRYDGQVVLKMADGNAPASAAGNETSNDAAAPSTAVATPAKASVKQHRSVRPAHHAKSAKKVKR
jgi:cell division protein FtsQ